MKNLCILGATGSIGQQTLNVVRKNKSNYQITAVSAHQNHQALFDICKEFTPKYAVITKPDSYKAFNDLIKQHNLKTEVLTGAESLNQIASLLEVDQVIAGIVGGAGLYSIHSAVKQGKTILLANKESLVMTGHILLDEVQKHQATILPLDSEHNALFQCMPADQGFRCQSLQDAGIDKLILTASGGPFRNTPIKDLSAQTPEQACKHPNWEMGRKISIDSATMMNKGLEYIEASLLFDATPSQLDVIIHPQSIIHSLVRYKDGTHLAQMGASNMQIPIAHALAYPNRIKSGAEMLDLAKQSLEFHEVDYNRYPCLALAIDISQDHELRIALNAANEIAVQAFLDTKINFTQIHQIVQQTIDQSVKIGITNIDDVFEFDQISRQLTREQINKL